ALSSRPSPRSGVAHREHRACRLDHRILPERAVQISARYARRHGRAMGLAQPAATMTIRTGGCETLYPRRSWAVAAKRLPRRKHSLAVEGFARRGGHR